MADITELIARMKAAAQELNGETWHYARPSIYGRGYIINGAGQTVVCTSDGDVPANCARFIETANPENILELTEALEKAQRHENEWKELCNAAALDLDDWEKIDDKSRELVCKLTDALIRQKAISEDWERKAISNFEECAKMSQRIAELEARTLTVKLPEYRNSPDMHTKQFYEAIGFNQGLDACIESILAAGIKFQIEEE